MKDTGNMATAIRNYPHPFADEWRYEDPSTMNFPERLVRKRGLIPVSSRHANIPKYTGKVPVYGVLAQLPYLIPFAIAPSAIRVVFTAFTGRTIHSVGMFFIAWFVYYAMFGRYGDHLNNLALKFGYLDGNVERDSIARGQVPKMFQQMLTGISMRAAMLVFLAYDRDEPLNLSLWLPLQLCAMSIIADFMYYWVHRLTHEVDWLWYLHRLHHTTKHPNFLLLSYADEPQEIFDALASPIFMYMLYPVSFDTLAIWTVLYLSIETMGHAGLRIYYPPVLTTPFLRPFGLEVVLEDHDLHHRMGWRKSFNYSKQSGIWDALFGTRGERIETYDENVDWDSSLDEWLTKQSA